MAQRSVRKPRMSPSSPPQVRNARRTPSARVWSYPIPSELFAHFAEHFGIRRTEAGDFFDELHQLTEQELLRCGEFVLPGVVKLVVQ